MQDSKKKQKAREELRSCLRRRSNQSLQSLRRGSTMMMWDLGPEDSRSHIPRLDSTIPREHSTLVQEFHLVSCESSTENVAQENTHDQDTGNAQKAGTPDRRRSEERLPPIYKQYRVKNRSSPTLKQDPNALASLSDFKLRPPSNVSHSMLAQEGPKTDYSALFDGKRKRKLTRPFLASAGYTIIGENDKLGQLLQILSTKKNRENKNRGPAGRGGSLGQMRHLRQLGQVSVGASMASSAENIEEVGRPKGYHRPEPTKIFLPSLSTSRDTVSVKRRNSASGPRRYLTSGAISESHEASQLLNKLYDKARKEKRLPADSLRDLGKKREQERKGNSTSHDKIQHRGETKVTLRSLGLM